MLGSVVLDVAIGMAFIYLLMSLIASVVQEMLSAFMQLRAANLERGMRSLFSGDSVWGQDLVNGIYNHGLVRGLYSDPKMDLKNVPATQSQVLKWATSFHDLRVQAGNQVRYVMRWLTGLRPWHDVTDASDAILLPAYIPSRTFALALIDLLNNNKATGQDAMNAITDSLSKHHWIYRENKAGEALFALAVDAKGDLTVFQANLEDWYNDAMDRVSAWYKRYTQRVLLMIGLVLAVTLNVDTIRVAKTMWSDRDVRQAMVNAAGDYMQNHPDSATPGTQAATPPGDAAAQGTQGAQAATAQVATTGDAAQLKAKLNATVQSFDEVTSSALLPVGWKYSAREYWDGFSWSGFRSHWKGSTLHGLRLGMGWLLTAIAVSLGAPFWFDTLNRFMVVRSTIKPQEKSQVEGSKD